MKPGQPGQQTGTVPLYLNRDNKPGLKEKLSVPVYGFPPKTPFPGTFVTSRWVQGSGRVEEETEYVEPRFHTSLTGSPCEKA